MNFSRSLVAEDMDVSMKLEGETWTSNRML